MVNRLLLKYFGWSLHLYVLICLIWFKDRRINPKTSMAYMFKNFAPLDPCGCICHTDLIDSKNV